MKLTGLKPRTLLTFWTVVALAVALLVVGVVSWMTGFSRLNDIKTAQARANQPVAPTPLASVADLEQVYQSARQSYDRQDFAAAINSFKEGVSYRADYRDQLAYLLLSYRGLAQLQSEDLARLGQAPQNFQAAYDLTQKYGPQLTNQFNQNPSLLPNDARSYEVLVSQLQQKQNWAANYAAGNSATLNQTPDGQWWNDAIKAWEPVYQVKPDYLQDNPELSLSRRLADTYYTQATYLCRAKGDYSGSLSAINRAIEIGRLSKLPADRQTAFLNQLHTVNQTYCKVN